MYFFWRDLALNHMECTFGGVTAFIQHNYFDIHVVVCISVLFLFIVEWWSLYGNTSLLIIH